MGVIKTLLKSTILAAGMLGLLWSGAMLFEKSLIFFPVKDPNPIEGRGSVDGCLYEDHFFLTEDDVRLHGRWFFSPADRGAEGLQRRIVLFFHGNAGNLSGRTELMVRLVNLGAEVMIIDYRGYGHSEGRPSEEGVYRDARAAWNFLTIEHEVPPDQIIVFGKSLGGAVAVDLASTVTPAGLIVQSSFTSVPAMAARHYPFVPGFALRTKMDSESKIDSITCPKLFVHSTHDEIVPFEMGRTLFETAGGPKTFFEITGAGHNETLAVGGSRYLESIRGFLASIPSAQSP